MNSIDIIYFQCDEAHSSIAKLLPVLIFKLRGELLLKSPLCFEVQCVTSHACTILKVKNLLVKLTAHAKLKTILL